jgi:energy-coupling factor transporter ATP-binding protein EcfA2
MAGTTRHLFARGNTARGVHSLYASAYQGLSRIFLLTGYPGTGKSTLLRELAESMIKQGHPVELFHSPFDPDDLDGLIIKDLQVGIADGRVSEGLETVPTGELVRVDLAQAVDDRRIPQGAVESLHTKIRETRERAYETFAAALRIHDEWEAIYIGQMDFAKADQIGQELASAFFGDQRPDRTANVRHLFFGAATPRGAVDHIPTLTTHLERRILIKGRPGSGKSTMLKRLAAAAEAQGVDVEVFHCGFDPNSLDMLIFPELSLAIFDSTAPHEYFPSQSSDEILDMYARAITPGTDERYASELQAIQERYAQKMQEATTYLLKTQQLHTQMKSHFVASSDFDKVKQLASQLQEAIEATQTLAAPE